MSGPPKARSVRCPECEAIAFAVIPADTVVAHHEEDTDGKVWTTCSSCGERFLVHYRSDA